MLSPVDDVPHAATRGSGTRERGGGGAILAIRPITACCRRLSETYNDHEDGMIMPILPATVAPPL